MKNKLGGKIMTEFFTLRLKKDLTDDNDENEKSKATKKFVIKWKLKITDYKNCLETNQAEK